MNTPEMRPNASESAPGPVEGQGSAPPCEGCGQAFLAKRRWQRFCSNSCRSDWHRRRDMPTAERLEDLERRVKALEAKLG